MSSKIFWKWSVKNIATGYMEYSKYFQEDLMMSLEGEKPRFFPELNDFLSS